MSTVKISEYTGDISGRSGSFDFIKVTGGITASNLQLDAETLFIGGTPFSKSELDRLKEGKTITTSANRLTKAKSIPSRASRPTKGSSPSQVLSDIQKVDALVNTADDNTFIQSNVAGEFDIVVNNTSSLAITTSSVDISVPVFLPSITGSTEVTGSLRVVSNNQQIEFDAGSGGFAVNNLLDLLANFSSSNVEGGVTEGDINLDGQVNISDLLLGLGGYGNPAFIANNILIPPNINHQYIGPVMQILSPVSMSISTGSFVSITL